MLCRFNTIILADSVMDINTSRKNEFFHAKSSFDFFYFFFCAEMVSLIFLVHFLRAFCFSIFFKELSAHPFQVDWQIDGLAKSMGLSIMN